MKKYLFFIFFSMYIFVFGYEANIGVFDVWYGQYSGYQTIPGDNFAYKYRFEDCRIDGINPKDYGTITIPISFLDWYHYGWELHQYNIYEISKYACKNNNFLTGLILSDGLRTINSQAFYQCMNLSKVTFNGNVTNLRENAFYNCTNLTEVIFLGQNPPPNILNSGVLDFAKKVRFRKEYNDNYISVIPNGISYGYVLEKDSEWLNVEGQIFLHSSSNWQGDYEESIDGEGSMRSGKISHSQESWIETTIKGPARISFYWKSSTEEYHNEVFDYAFLSVNGEKKGNLNNFELHGISIGGKKEWEKVVYDVLESGDCKIRWTYVKDEVDECDVGQDCVWVDNISISPLVNFSFSLNGGLGSAPKTLSSFANSEIILPSNEGFTNPKHTFVGWSDGKTIYPGKSTYIVGVSNVVFTAQWEENKLDAPIILCDQELNDGVLLSKSTEISMISENNSRIFYTLDGSIPSESSALYISPFVVDGLFVNIRAIAIKDDFFDSPIANLNFKRMPSDVSEVINLPGKIVVTNSVNPWICVYGDVAHDGVAALRSAQIDDGEKSEIEFLVLGEGTISYWWKASTEMIRGRKYDYVSFQVDGVEKSWLGGEQNWSNETFSVVGEGVHSLKWVYQKNDNQASQGEDAVWLDDIVWTSSVPFPNILDDKELISVFSGTVDEIRLKLKLKSMTEYQKFINWIEYNGIKQEDMKHSPNAWFSYALDSVDLVKQKNSLSNNDIKINDFSTYNGSNNSYNLVFGVDGVHIGGNAQIDDVFNIVGAENLCELGLLQDTIDKQFINTNDGFIKAIVTPKNDPSTFFFRVLFK